VFEKDTTGKQKCIGYVNYDYTRDLDKRRSTRGYIFTLFQVLVSWCSILQSTVTLSTTEAECMAMKEAIWLQGLLDDLRIDQDLLKINCDNMNVIYLPKNQVYHARAKHIDVRFHFVWEILDESDIELRRFTRKRIPPISLPKLFILLVAWVWWSSFG